MNENVTLIRFLPTTSSVSEDVCSFIFLFDVGVSASTNLTIIFENNKKNNKTDISIQMKMMNITYLLVSSLNC